MDYIFLDVRILAAYIKRKFLNEKKNEISPLKLQKSLYFLFAFWAGFITKNRNLDHSAEQEVNYNDLSPVLFNSSIEAWYYGPVIPDVYRCPDIMSYENQNFIDNLDYRVREFIDDLLKQLFNTSDFTLVNISHADSIWKKYYNPNDEIHDNIMPTAEIIEEYARK
ncbi:MAG: DUF4065 domain-containing protein [Endomicrobiaceae bacterium]|nr:DUF4065 domain-containing protein [Endomicrobiaceae bacterium]